jgi:hypothetical protein
VTPTRAAFDLPDAVRRAKRPQEARAAALAPVAVFGKPADVIRLPSHPRSRWRVREHTFGLVAASFIIAVAALGLLRTTIDNPSLTRGARPPSTSQPPPTTSGGDGGNQDPQDPTNVEPQPELRPFGPISLVANVVPAPRVHGPTQETKPPQEHEGGDSSHGGSDEGPDDPGRGDPGDGHSSRHRRNPPGNSRHRHHPCNGQHDGGIGHAVHGDHGHAGHGAYGDAGHGDHGHEVHGGHGKPGK